MKKLVLLSVIAILLALPATAFAGQGQEKVDVCHVTGTYDFGFGSEPVGHVISIADPAYQSHLDHGDLGDYIEKTLEDGTVVCKEPRWVLMETLTVPANSQGGATSTIALDPAGKYLFVASGTWSQYGNYMDAEYSTTNNWGTVYDGHYPPHEYLGANWADLRVNNTFVDWGAYAANHVYSLEYMGSGNVNFSIFEGDGTTGTVYPAWYGDNSGALIVQLYEQQ